MLSSYVMTLKADNNVINLNELEPFKGRTKEEVTEKYDIAKRMNIIIEGIMIIMRLSHH